MTDSPSTNLAPAPSATDRPLVSILLIAYNQEKQIADAVRSALAQTYTPLEIIISDDASSDATFTTIEAAIAGYRGPHKVIARRNAANQGINSRNWLRETCCSLPQATTCPRRIAVSGWSTSGSRTIAAPT
jgi:cellulose synthase/poly-beta-1,6-N-acetylglucosamine synthase-like glycosyltransferase